MIRFLLLLLMAFASATAVATDADRTVSAVQFPKGKSSIVITGSIEGRRYIDYRLRAGAGQTLNVSLTGSNGANYFNLLPPGSNDAAMAIGELNGNRFSGLLPDDGLYTIRVFLMRSAARRNETSNFKLSVAITGKPLKPVSAKVDAVIPGTPFHARTTAPCDPAYSTARECEVWVIRRGYDGTATVELRWTNDSNQPAKLRILFIKGEPVAADVPPPMTFTRNERGWQVIFNGDVRFEVPEPLVFGG